jgi:hypothetical protein
VFVAAPFALAQSQEWEMKISAMPALAICGLVLASVAARAADDEQGRKACMVDALTVCAKFIPDRQRVADCLVANRERISEPCRVLVSAHAASK